MLPIIPARGNHDGGPLYDQIFATPGGKGRNYFTTRLSPLAALVTLNSETSPAPDQRDWLASQLEQLRPEYPWLMATYHRPLFPAVKSPGKAKEHWVPLFDQFNVDLVMESDGHCIKRTQPIRDGKPDPTGVVYIGEGGLGAPQRTPHSDRWYVQPPGFASKGDHVQLLSVSPRELRVRVILLDGTIADEVTLQPRETEQTAEK